MQNAADATGNTIDSNRPTARMGCTSYRRVRIIRFLNNQRHRIQRIWDAMTGKTPPQRNEMMEKSEIEKLFISLEIDKRPSLLILLAADGTVNRLGTGKVDNTEHDLFIGITQDGLFERVLENVPQEILERRGAYDIPGRRGNMGEEYSQSPRS